MPANRRVGRVGAAEQTTPAMLHYEIHGESGPFILLVHGVLSSRAQWLPNVPALSQSFRPVVTELLGHGRSPAPEDPAAYAPSAYVGYFEQIREAVDSVSTAGATVRGQSLNTSRAPRR
jgi:pimeloyl-ACP methyl ester carboxylesterase